MNAATPHLLIADDDPDARLLLQEALADLGVAVQPEVRDGKELLEYLRGPPGGQARSPLVLLDLKMPRMDGSSALRELRADPALRTTPVVVLTTSSLPEDVTRSYDLGANAYVVKPQTFAELTAAVSYILAFWFGAATLDGSDGDVPSPD